MTLKEKFEQYAKKVIWIGEKYYLEESVLIAEEFAIGFAEWVNEEYNYYHVYGKYYDHVENRWYNLQELLEIYKKEKRIMKDKFVEQVVNKFEDRSAIGKEKYGTTLERNDLNLAEWLNHLQEELMDATLYIQKLKSELPDGLIITKESWANADKITLDGFVYVKYNDLYFINEV